MTLATDTYQPTKPNVLMKFYGCNGNYDFATDTRHMPIFSRRLSHERALDQGYGVQKFTGTLTGFFVGVSHHEIVDQYRKLKQVLTANNVTFEYSVNGVKVVNSVKIYIDDFDEPSDWKTYDGAYTINFHWFEKPDTFSSYQRMASGAGGIVANFVRSEPQPATSFIFLPTPNWGMKARHVKSAWTANTKTPYGREKGTEVVITLQGLLQEDSHHALKLKIEEMLSVFCPGAKGTLNYGEFSDTVRLYEAPEFPDTYPANYCHYKLKFIRYTEELFTFTVDKSYSRIHKFARIKNRLYCKKKSVREFMESGQYVTYTFRCLAITPERATEIIKQEMMTVIVEPTDNPSYEIEGGVEEVKDNGEVTVTARKYYKTAVRPNTETP